MTGTRKIHGLMLFVLGLLTLGAKPAHAQGVGRASGCAWQPGFHISGPSPVPSLGTPFHPELIYDSVVFDAGGGAALYVAGSFRSVDDQSTIGLAKWDGLTWTPLPSAGLPNEVFLSMATIDSGALAGIYTFGVGGLRRWDGAAWSALSTPPDGSSGYRLAAGDLGSGPRLFAGGSGFIYQWNGTSWSQLGGATNGPVSTLTVWNDGGGNKLYVGGSFTQIGAVGAARVARWNGLVWSPLGSGVADNGGGGEAKTLRGIGSRLYVGGTFTTAGGAAAANIASWNGSAWSPLAGGAAGAVEKLAVYDDGSGSILAASGYFDNLGGTPAARLATWNGSVWSAIDLGINKVFRTLIQFDQGDGNALFVGGQFATFGGAHPGNLRRWHDGTWSVVTAKPGGLGLDGTVGRMAVHDDGGGKKLYVAGRTPVTAGIGMVPYRSWLMEWDGASWTRLLGGSDIGAMLSYDDGSGSALYVGTYSPVQPFPLAHVGKWDGTTWTTLGGTTKRISTMAEYDDGKGKALYAAGADLPFGLPSDFDSNIAKWDGISWSAVGAGIFGYIAALAVYDDGGGPELYAAGDFTEIGDSSPTPAARIAKWDGKTWSPVGSGLDGQVLSMAVWNDGSGAALYVAGGFTTAGGVPAPGIAKWNGTAWSPVGGGSSGSYKIVVFDDGAGSALYVTGTFTTEGGKPIANAARWDGTSWTPIGTGDAPPGTMEVYDSGFGEALFFGGNFTAAGGIPSYSFAQFCRPGVFHDGFENGDFSAWSQAVP
jgi:hypothetical protein